MGHIISEEGVTIELEKIQAILDWPQPKTLKQLRGFLSFAGYYRRFVSNYGKLCIPLINLLTDAFHWNPAATEAFELLKKAMTSLPVLALPNFQKSFVIETDASGSGIGAMLMQQGHPIAFVSKGLSEKESPPINL